MHRVSLKAIIILVTVVSIYLYFFPPTKSNKFGAELQKNFDPVFGSWQLKDETSMLQLQLKKDTTYTLNQINNLTKDTVSDKGTFQILKFGVSKKDSVGIGFLTLQSLNNNSITYEIHLYKWKQLELIDKKTRLLTRFEKIIIE